MLWLPSLNTIGMLLVLFSSILLWIGNFYCPRLEWKNLFFLILDHLISQLERHACKNYLGKIGKVKLELKIDIKCLPVIFWGVVIPRDPPPGAGPGKSGLS